MHTGSLTPPRRGGIFESAEALAANRRSCRAGQTTWGNSSPTGPPGDGRIGSSSLPLKEAGRDIGGIREAILCFP